MGPETEDIYTDEFFEALSGVANALDNVEASMCETADDIWIVLQNAGSRPVL